MAADVKVFARNLEDEARRQVDTLASLDAFDGAKVRIMPDAHAGAGCVIGFTADLGEKVIPNLVGVDIGCGMLTTYIPQQPDFDRLDAVIRRDVPHGFGVHDEPTCDIASLGLRCFDHLRNVDRLDRSLGTLGGGNHFIAVDKEEGRFGAECLIVHTGSRNLGLQVANIYQQVAMETCDADVPKDLKWLTGRDADDYLHDMRICQEWAARNRELIAMTILDGVNIGGGHWFHTTHNYIGDDNVIRKGAISAKRGESVLIPLNMRDGCLLCTGLGNADWNESAPHGAGRRMSRRKARETLDVDEFKAQMGSVWSSTVCVETIDEAPGAYKDPQEIVDAIDGVTVTVKRRLRELYNFKSTQVSRHG